MIVQPEYPIPGGSKSGLRLARTGEFGEAWLVGTPTGNIGWADIVGFVSPSWGDIYEIKKQVDLLKGVADVAWYIGANNSNPSQPTLRLGYGYTWWPAEEIIGTNPYYSGQLIMASMKVPGVITWKGKSKSQVRQPQTQPIYVWEWNPIKREVEERELYPAPANSCELSGKTIGDTVMIGGTAFIVWGGIQVVQGVVGFILAGPPGAVAGVALPP